MVTKSEKIIKRIIKAIGERQAVLLIGDWQEELIQGIKEKQNSIQQLVLNNGLAELSENSFTRIVVDFSDIINHQKFYIEARRLLLPTGKLIVSANSQEWLSERIWNLITRKVKNMNTNTIKIKPKVLQDQIHDNDFLIDGYYGYPGGQLLMMAEIQNKEVSTLFSSEKQETVVE